VELIDDLRFEGDESLTLTIADVGANAMIADGVATGVIRNDDDTDGSGGTIPVEAWNVPQGGVTTSGNRISFSGRPAGWGLNAVTSLPLVAIGLADPFEIVWTLESDPLNTVWIVGLGVVEAGADWTDVEFGLRSSDGQLRIFENGTWRASGAALSTGDTISIRVQSGSLDYRHNDVVVRRTSIAGNPAFYIDSSFRRGAIALSVVAHGNAGAWQGMDTTLK
jgi:hypothetical protein